MKFETLNTLDINNINSWKTKIFLTFDIDWCSDEVLLYTLNILEKYNIKATFFVTHETKLLDRMQNNSNIELGIHPNFNPLLNGDFIYGSTIDEVISYYKKIVPEAISVRSHSLTCSSRILDSFTNHGLKTECNTFIPFSSSMELKAWEHWDKQLLRVPYSWGDDANLIYNWGYDINKFLNNDGIKMFAFHPIHIFLNSEDIERYVSSKERHYNYNALIEDRNDKHYGSFDFLIDLIEKIKATK